MTTSETPLLADREALAEVIHEALEAPWGCHYEGTVWAARCEKRAKAERCADALFDSAWLDAVKAEARAEVLDAAREVHLGVLAQARREAAAEARTEVVARVEGELDYAEAHARNVVDDETLVATGLIRYALNNPKEA